MPPIGWATGAGPLAPSARPHGQPQCVPAGSFDVAPLDLDLPDQRIDACAAGELALFGEMGVAEGGEDGLMTEDLLHFQQVNARFNQMGGIAVAQAVRRNSFLKPQSWMTWCKVAWMPPRSKGVVARCARLRPP